MLTSVFGLFSVCACVKCIYTLNQNIHPETNVLANFTMNGYHILRTDSIFFPVDTLRKMLVYACIRLFLVNV